ncbi:MAG: 3-deoxy-manno-octulosonate cytidylyltransferase, partial [Verrucomicrobiae bacterium]|nr:3-deoxy-manno-octulosonate cytidylyltransferase [Verrucomicrobiae bacterium]
MKLLGVIPARYASTRFPGKPLHLIAGRPLLERVVERCRLARSLADVVIATDDERIAEVARRFARVEMTRADHPSGTDRIAEVAARIPADGYVNVQGDEPLMDPAVVDAVGDLLSIAEMSTAATPISRDADYESPNVVKAVVGTRGNALYFSRRPLPYLRDHAHESTEAQRQAFPFWKHLGIYGYRRDTL